MPQYTVQLIHDIGREDQGPIITTFRSYEADMPAQIPDELVSILRTKSKPDDVVCVYEHDPSKWILTKFEYQPSNSVVDLNNMAEFELWLRGDDLYTFRKLVRDKEDEIKSKRAKIQEEIRGHQHELTELDKIDVVESVRT